ncbi:MAG: 3-dehydroquinate synthase II [Promethearchaeota archaeon]
MKHIIINVWQISEESKLQSLVQTALNKGFSNFLINSSQRAKFHAYPNITLFEVDDNFPTALEGKYLRVISPINPSEDGLIQNSKKESNQISENESINSQKSLYLEFNQELSTQQMEKIQEALKNHVFAVILQPNDWKVIPIENLIALFQQASEPKPLLIVNISSQLQDYKLVTNILEQGADGVLFSPKTHDDLEKICELQHNRFQLPLITGKISKIKLIPTGDRVCVDTSSLLQPGEGLLVGNTAKGFALVEAEVNKSEFVEPRPFRINAGDVSEYLLIPKKGENGEMDLSTKYLVEFKAGDQIWVFNTKGFCRSVAVSRVKIENRPLLLFEISVKLSDTKEEITFPVTFQYAETVRLFNSKGNSIPVSELAINDEVLVCIGPSATHFGMPIREKIIEK